ncbi:hypothetical protein AMTR_s00079p00159110 [Amborella trichopoda]|uniref:Uncharacterized protein n=1 Tax=Amborella trichopoda TaxID=13333 RepID=W1P8J5_AMBTC|nr:hypothetical protein AMTR_s00079p00159110 [Amborella trichopoda]
MPFLYTSGYTIVHCGFTFAKPRNRIWLTVGGIRGPLYGACDDARVRRGGYSGGLAESTGWESFFPKAINLSRAPGYFFEGSGRGFS